VSHEPAWLESSLDRYYMWGLAFMGVLLLGFPLYKFREPALRRTAMEEQQASYAKVGAVLFQQHCTGCHGPAGTGGSVAPTLYAKEFLESTRDAQVGWLITGGVSGTAMSAYGMDLGGPFTVEQVRQLVVYIRTWEASAPSVPAWRTGPKVVVVAPVPEAPAPSAVASPPAAPAAASGAVHDSVPPAAAPAVAPPRGAVLYAQYCIACHGANGIGGIGPTLNAKEHFAGTTDERMRTIIERGVAGTAMSPWGAVAGGPLSAADVTALIGYVRTWAPTAPSIPNWKKGRPPVVAP
jgi:mono/diheme cytochrome c family protein